MRRRVRSFATALSAVALWWSCAAFAQEAAAPAAPVRSGPEAVAAADIPLRADADERFASEVIQRSHGQDPMENLGPRLEALGEAVQRESGLFKRDELKVLSITRLESLERHWTFFGKQLEKWRRDLKQASSQYTDDAAELSRRRTAWELTRASTETVSLAPALANRVQVVLAQIALAEQAVSGPIDQQARLSRRANIVEASVVAGQKAVAAAITYNDSRLARVDSPPIWVAWHEPVTSGKALKSLKTGLEVETRFLEEYNAANREYQRVLHVGALLLLPLLLWLSRRSRRVVSEDPEIQASTRVLQRPI